MQGLLWGLSFLPTYCLLGKWEQFPLNFTPHNKPPWAHFIWFHKCKPVAQSRWFLLSSFIMVTVCTRAGGTVWWESREGKGFVLVGTVRCLPLSFSPSLGSSPAAEAWSCCCCILSGGFDGASQALHTDTGLFCSRGWGCFSLLLTPLISQSCVRGRQLKSSCLELRNSDLDPSAFACPVRGMSRAALHATTLSNTFLSPTGSIIPAHRPVFRQISMGSFNLWYMF